VKLDFLSIEDLVYWKVIKKNELTEVLKLNPEFILVLRQAIY